jgi:hypothetical protein
MGITKNPNQKVGKIKPHKQQTLFERASKKENKRYHRSSPTLHYAQFKRPFA